MSAGSGVTSGGAGFLTFTGCCGRGMKVTLKFRKKRCELLRLTRSGKSHTPALKQRLAYKTCAGHAHAHTHAHTHTHTHALRGGEC